MRRKVGWFVLLGAVLPLVVTGSASAQGSTMLVTPQVASPGQTVTVTGGSFSTAAGTSPVALRLSTRDGDELAPVNLDTRGRFTATFPIPPSLAPGTYLILATQTYANGRTLAFTPARTRIRIQAAGARSGTAAGGPPVALSLGILALVLMAAGATLSARRLRTFHRPTARQLADASR